MSKRIVARPAHRGNSRALRTDPPCIDLRSRFGKRWRVETEQGANPTDPWGLIVPCRAGHIFPWGGNVLAAASTAAGPIANRLAHLPRVTIQQDGSDGITVLFDVEDVGRVAKVMHPRRARRLSEARRRDCAAHLAKVRPKTLRQQRGGERPCVQPCLFG